MFMAKWNITEEEPIFEFLIGKTNVEIEGFTVNFDIYYVPKRNLNLFRIRQEFDGQSYYQQFICTLSELFLHCYIGDGVQPSSWRNVDTYKKMLYLRDEKSKFRYRKYIKMKKEFERLLSDIAHKREHQNSFWKRNLQNKRKGGFKYISETEAKAKGA
jgi:hypothetical protein